MAKSVNLSTKSVQPQDPAAVRKGVEAAAVELRRQYQMHERLAPVSKRTAERKAGTKGEGKPLVGRRGPRMISRIRAWVNGVEVGGGGDRG